MKNTTSFLNPKLILDDFELQKYKQYQPHNYLNMSKPKFNLVFETPKSDSLEPINFTDQDFEELCEKRKLTKKYKSVEIYFKAQ